MENIFLKNLPISSGKMCKRNRKCKKKFLNFFLNPMADKTLCCRFCAKEYKGEGKNKEPRHNLF